MTTNNIQALKHMCSLDKFISGFKGIVPYNPNKKAYDQECPFCGRKDGFAWYEATSSYHCFGCEEHGDYIDMIQKKMHMELTEACQYLSQDILGIPFDIGERIIKKENEADRQWREGLDNYKKYGELIREGYYDKKKIDLKKVNIPIGAFLSVEHTWTGGIQIFNSEKKRIGIQRLSKQCMPKNESGLGFFMTSINYKKDIYLVEGVSDYLTMLQWGIENVIGLYSINTNLKDIQFILQKAQQSIYCLLDSDCYPKEGQLNGSYMGAKLALKLKGIFGKRMKVLFVEEDPHAEVKCKDINDLLCVKKWDRERFLEWINNSELGKSFAEISSFIPGESMETSDGIAELFIGNHYIAFIGDSFWIANENYVWYETEQEEIKNMLAEYIEHNLNLCIKPAKREEIFSIIKYKCFNRSKKLKETLESTVIDSEYIKLANGKLMINEPKIIAYSAEDCVISTINISTNNMGGSCPNFHKFMHDITKSHGEDQEEVIQLLMEFMGYCLYPAAPFDKIFYIQGGGGNGKSTFLSIIEMLLGEKNIINYEVSHLANNNFAQYDLLGKYANIVSDAGKYTRLDEPILKKITGGDRITASRKFKDSVTFRPFCKVIISSNYEPNISDGGEWLERRLVMIPFNTVFSKFGVTPDPNILDKIFLEKEAIFWEAYESLRVLLKRGYFKIPENITSFTKKSIELKDPVVDFYNTFGKLEYPIINSLSYTQEYIGNASSGDIMPIHIKGIEDKYVYSIQDLYSEFKIFFMNNYTSKLIHDKTTFLKRLCTIGNGDIKVEILGSKTYITIAKHRQ